MPAGHLVLMIVPPAKPSRAPPCATRAAGGAIRAGLSRARMLPGYVSRALAEYFGTAESFDAFDYGFDAIRNFLDRPGLLYGVSMLTRTVFLERCAGSSGSSARYRRPRWRNWSNAYPWSRGGLIRRLRQPPLRPVGPSGDKRLEYSRTRILSLLRSMDCWRSGRDIGP